MNTADFYFKGVSRIDLDIIPDFHELTVLLNQHLVNFRENVAHWIERYPGVFDLCGTDGDQLFQVIANLYADTNLSTVISEITGMELAIGDSVLRLNSNSQHSYMPKHRDTFKRGNKIVGRIQPLMKIAYFPEILGSDKKVFTYYQGTQLRYSENRLLDHLMAFAGRKISFKPDDRSLVLFNSFGYHAAHPADVTNSYSPRLLINLCQKTQVRSFSRHNRSEQ